MRPLPALAELYACYYAHPRNVVEVWEPADRYDAEKPPNRVGCTRCNRMVRINWCD